MSTNITTALTNMKVTLRAMFPQSSGYYELLNPYLLPSNTTTMLEQGWGVAVGQAINTNLEISCRISVDRAFEVILMRRRFASDLDTDYDDEAELAMLEDQFLIIKQFEKEPDLNASSNGIARFVFKSDNGIEPVIANNQSYIKLVSVFELSYFENLEP